jgi:hypothetical protein
MAKAIGNQQLKEWTMSKGVDGTVYVLHIDPPYPRDERGSVEHYIGWTAGTAEERLANHTSPLIEAAKKAGHTVKVATTKAGTRHDERRLKNQRNARRFCDHCQAVAA